MSTVAIGFAKIFFILKLLRNIHVVGHGKCVQLSDALDPLDSLNPLEHGGNSHVKQLV